MSTSDPKAQAAVAGADNEPRGVLLPVLTQDGEGVAVVRLADGDGRELLQLDALQALGLLGDLLHMQPDLLRAVREEWETVPF